MLASGKTNFCYSCLRRGLAGNCPIQESGTGRGSTLWSSGSAKVSLSRPRQGGGHRRTRRNPPREYMLFFTGLPSALLPLLSPQLRWRNHRAAGGQGCEEAHPLTTEPPQTGTPQTQVPPAGACQPRTFPASPRCPSEHRSLQSVF